MAERYHKCSVCGDGYDSDDWGKEIITELGPKDVCIKCLQYGGTLRVPAPAPRTYEIHYSIMECYETHGRGIDIVLEASRVTWQAVVPSAHIPSNSDNGDVAMAYYGCDCIVNNRLQYGVINLKWKYKVEIQRNG